MKIYIYKIYFLTNDICYIGQTKNPKLRMQAHLKANTLVGKALRKYDNWKISILHTCKTRDEANSIEIEEIRNFNSIKPNGYNVSRGGEGNFNPTKETREKIKLSQEKTYAEIRGMTIPEYRQYKIEIQKRLQKRYRHFRTNGIPTLQKQYDEQYELKFGEQ